MYIYIIFKLLEVIFRDTPQIKCVFVTSDMLLYQISYV